MHFNFDTNCASETLERDAMHNAQKYLLEMKATGKETKHF